MVGYYFDSRNVLDFIALKRISLFLIISGLVGIFIGCNSSSFNSEGIPFKVDNNTLSKWEDVFGEDEILSFTKDGSEFEFYTIGGLVINSTGDYFIIDGKRGKIIQFNAAGKFKQFVGTNGEGPGEYTIIAALSMDKNDDLYIFDIPQMRIIKYSAPGYLYEKQINYGKPIQDIITVDNGDLILYSSNIGEVLYRVNGEGNIINKTFTPRQETFRLFITHFNLGSFCRYSNTNFLFIFPEEYRVYVFNDDLKIEKTFFAASPSRFFPTAKSFPNQLSPYNFTPQHAKWMMNTLYPANIEYLGNGRYVILLIEYQNLSEKLYLNIHDMDGITLAAGIEIPFGGILRYAKDGYIYVVEKDSIDEKGDISPFKLHRFKLKI